MTEQVEANPPLTVQRLIDFIDQRPYSLWEAEDGQTTLLHAAPLNIEGESYWLGYWGEKHTDQNIVHLRLCIYTQKPEHFSTKIHYPNFDSGEIAFRRISANIYSGLMNVEDYLRVDEDYQRRGWGTVLFPMNEVLAQDLDSQFPQRARRKKQFIVTDASIPTGWTSWIALEFGYFLIETGLVKKYRKDIQ